MLIVISKKAFVIRGVPPAENYKEVFRMLDKISIVKKKLMEAIIQLCEVSWMFVKDTERDFTKKITIFLYVNSFCIIGCGCL